LKKGRHDHHSSFVRLGRDLIFRSEEWKRLSPRAKVLYVTLKAKYNGANNGEIRLCYSELSDHSGFRSRKSISTAITELEREGWISRTKRGGLHRYENRFGLTGKFDVLL
jgi:hypothetical protein